MSMPDLWSPAALAPKPRAAVRQIAIVPRERIYPAKKKLPRPTAIQNLAAQRERERQEAAAAAWHEGFRAAEVKYTLGIEYEATNYGLTFAPTMAAIIAEEVGADLGVDVLAGDLVEELSLLRLGGGQVLVHRCPA